MSEGVRSVGRIKGRLRGTALARKMTVLVEDAGAVTLALCQSGFPQIHGRAVGASESPSLCPSTAGKGDSLPKEEQRQLFRSVGRKDTTPSFSFFKRGGGITVVAD